MKWIRTRQLHQFRNFTNLVLKRNFSVENKFASKIKRRKWDDDYMQHGFFIPEVKNGAISRLLRASFAILNIATSFSLIQNYGVIYKRNTTSEQVFAIFQATARTLMQTLKFPTVNSRK